MHSQNIGSGIAHWKIFVIFCFHSKNHFQIKLTDEHHLIEQYKSYSQISSLCICFEHFSLKNHKKKKKNPCSPFALKTKVFLQGTFKTWNTRNRYVTPGQNYTYLLQIQPPTKQLMLSSSNGSNYDALQFAVVY